MKWTAIILFVAQTAWAGTVWIDAETNVIDRPNRIGGTANPTDEQLAAHGILAVSCPDDIEQRFWTFSGAEFVSIPQEEIDATLEAEKAALDAAVAEAEAQASLPQTSETGFAVMDDEGHWVELLPTGDSLPVIGVQVSNSPLTKEERDQMKAERKAAHAALKAAAKSARNDKEKIALLMQAVFGVEE